MTPHSLLRTLVFVAALALLLAGCGRNMADQARLDPLQASPFFDDGSGQRPLIEGTVSRQRGAVDPAFFTGQDAAGLLTELPIALTLELLQRGQERYDIYCSVCHGYTGDGDGMIVQRGFPQPTSFHEQRLLDAPVGYYFSAMTNGFGRMFSYASRIPAEDRWAIAAYLKALQLSQNAGLADVPESALRDLGVPRADADGSVRR
jgi:mono/diheme cytochrome c family protein